MYHFLAVAINSDGPNGNRSDTNGAATRDRVDADVDALVAEGRYADAAMLADQRGDPLRATELYERIWEFSRAADCARRAGDLGRALKNAIDARDEQQIIDLSTVLDENGADGQRLAMEVFASRRRFADAARRAETLGEFDVAVEYYTNAHQDLDAARLLEALGRDRDAGRRLERFIELGSPGAEQARAQLQLGTLLARRMDYETSARYLQAAARSDETREQARRALIVSLAAMGLRDAARDVLVEARTDNPELATDVETFLKHERAADGAVDPAETQDQSEGQMIGGRYRTEELIGTGGTGRVYRAHDEVRDRTCAVKLFHIASSPGNQAYERFVREAKLAGALRHPNLVEVHDVSPEKGYLVMELMSGGSLASRISQNPLSASAVRRMTLDVLAGLELAHRRGVIHRDVKPANIFFDARGTAKLGDFGIAHLLDLGQTQTGGLIGTLAYMSPEQITGAPLSIAADLYSLGVTMFEALVGRLPFLGPDFVAQHLGETPPHPSTMAETIAPGWDAILARLLCKSPGDRYPSIDELRQAIVDLDLGESDRPTILVLPRTQLRSETDAGERGSPGLAGERAAGSENDQNGDRRDDGSADEEQSGPRYQFETPIGTTEVSDLSRAVDVVLNRSVILERCSGGSEAEEQRLYALARGGGPFLQRALAYDKSSGVAVFEAPSGTLLSEVFSATPPSPRQAIRLLKRLSRAVAPLHEIGTAHGAIGENTVLVDEDVNPTVLICGLGRADNEAARPRPEDDVAAIIGLIAGTIAAQPTPRGLFAALVPDIPDDERTAIEAVAAPADGEELYALADAVEIALLKAWRRATRT